MCHIVLLVGSGDEMACAALASAGSIAHTSVQLGLGIWTDAYYFHLVTFGLRSCILGHAVILGKVEKLHFSEDGSSGMMNIMVQGGCHSCMSVIMQLILHLTGPIQTENGEISR